VNPQQAAATEGLERCPVALWSPLLSVPCRDDLLSQSQSTGCLSSPRDFPFIPKVKSSLCPYTVNNCQELTGLKSIILQQEKILQWN